MNEEEWDKRMDVLEAAIENLTKEVKELKKGRKKKKKPKPPSISG